MRQTKIFKFSSNIRNDKTWLTAKVKKLILCNVSKSVFDNYAQDYP